MAADCSDWVATLPPPVLDRILEHAFTLDRQLVPTALAHLGTLGHHSARRVLARTLVLQDDDDLLADAQEQTGASTLLARVLNDPDWASYVRHLAVVNPASNELAPPFGLTGAEDQNESEDALSRAAPPPPPPLDDAALFLCLSRLESLTSFTWHSHRAPPPQLCLALGQAARNLTHFRLELVPAPAGVSCVPSSPPPAAQATQGQQATSPTSPSLIQSPLLAGTTSNVVGTAAARWDAPHLAALPDKLTHLSLSSLSASGARTLADDALAASLGATLEHLELAKTLFVDDHLLAAIGEHAKGLQTLKIREMAGTKLSEAGLKHVLQGCPDLTELHLDGVQGEYRGRVCSQLVLCHGNSHR